MKKYYTLGMPNPEKAHPVFMTELQIIQQGEERFYVF